MILIVDFGSQTAHLIGRRLRQLGVDFQYILPDEVLENINEFSPKGIIFSGGPSSVYGENAPTIDKNVFEKNIPIFGICYGLQLTAYLMGGEVKNDHKEYGPEEVLVSQKGGFLTDRNNFTAVMSHGDTVTKMPEGFKTLASTRSVEFAAVENPEKKVYGVQFHPEVKHTEIGMDILENFVVNICKEEKNPKIIDIDKIISEIKETVGDKKVIGAVSGGVDSTVAGFLIAKAIGENLIPVYVESGLMREGTKEKVKHIFTQLVKSNLVIVEAKDRFMEALKGKSDPEEKRKAIGKLYIDIFNEEALKHKDAEFLAQGTIYSDVIESKGSKNASNIKSHHNVGGLPKDLKFKLLEPMRNYYKDEVREIGRKSGIPEDLVMQQPFPGPGYAVRIRGEVTEFRLSQVKIADLIVIDEVKKAGLYDSLFQCYAIMSGAYSTAVKGDERNFSEVVAIRAIESDDVMTAKWVDFPYEVLQKMSSRIVNEVPSVSRVVYDITTKPPATMEWE